MDEKVLSLDTLTCLSPLLPTEEESKAVKSYTGPRERLGVVEEFFLVFSSVEHVQKRLSSFVFKREFGSTARKLEDAVDGVLGCLSQLRSSQRLKDFLGLVLRYGNVLNLTTSRHGAAYGFHIEGLLKLKDLRSGDNTTNFLRFLAQKALDMFGPDALKFSDELSKLRKASRVERAYVQTEILQLKHNIAALQSLIKGLRVLEQGEPWPAGTSHDPSAQVQALATVAPFALGEFCEYAAVRVEEFSSKWTEVEKEFENCLLYFGTPASLAWEEFFAIFHGFTQQVMGIVNGSSESRLVAASVHFSSLEFTTRIGPFRFSGKFRRQRDCSGTRNAG